MANLKTQELKIEEIDSKRRKQAVRLMDEIRKKHRVRIGEKTSTEIIRNFREKRYHK